MPTLPEKSLAFEFPELWEASKYEEWPYYKKQFCSVGTNTKAVDFVALEPSPVSTAWLVEVKDYRRVTTVDRALWDTVADKVRDSLAGIAAQSFHDRHDEHPLAKRLLRASRVRVVLHLEQVDTTSKLFPRPYNPVDVQQKLRQRLRGVDPHVLVRDSSARDVQWRVTAGPLGP